MEPMDARRHRSKGLARVNRLTGWLAGGALVASGAFMALLAHPHASAGSAKPATGPVGGSASPGVTAGPTTTVDPFAGSGLSDGSGVSDGSNGDGSVATAPLQAPVQVPQVSPRQSQVSSGGS